MLVEDRCKKTDTPTMTDDKPMISITPAPAIMFSAAAKRTSGVIASRSGGWTRNCNSRSRGGRCTCLRLQPLEVHPSEQCCSKMHCAEVVMAGNPIPRTQEAKSGWMTVVRPSRREK